MTDTIYLVNGSAHVQEILDGFATNGAEVAQIIHNHWINKMYAEPGEFTVDVNLLTKRATVKEGDETTTYFILPFDRAKIPK